MAQYIKISSELATSCNTGLKKSITFIGKRYGKLAYKGGFKSNEYLKSGVRYIAKRFGRFRISAIKYMYEPKDIKGREAKEWCFNKQVYAKAYSLIVDLLLKSAPEDRNYIYDLLNQLYRESLHHDPSIQRVCSNALIYIQKRMLSLNRNNTCDGLASGSILRTIESNERRIP